MVIKMNLFKPHSDVIVGATDGSNFFVDDRYIASTAFTAY